MNERQYLYLDFQDEVNLSYARIVTEAWSRILNGERFKVSPTRQRTARQEVAGMERAAVILLESVAEYLEDDIAPEERIKRDRARYEKAYAEDVKDL